MKVEGQKLIINKYKKKYLNINSNKKDIYY
jgi:hypothetical protein